jgi:hypothetical protein
VLWTLNWTLKAAAALLVAGRGSPSGESWSADFSEQLTSAKPRQAATPLHHEINPAGCRQR